MSELSCHTENLIPHHVRVRSRDGNYCQMCSQRMNKRHMHVHCIDGNTANEDMANLITLCARCHGIAHVTVQQSRAFLRKAVRR